MLGAILTLLLIVGIGWTAAVDFDLAKILVLTFFVNAFGGRAAGVGICIMHDLGSTLTISYNFFVEMMIVCFTYSIFVLTATNYVQIPWMRKFMERLAQKALEQKEKIESYGWIGLFLFVMIPLPITGPVVGSVIGYMLRISLVRNFSASASGTLVAIIVWFFCFDFLEERFKAIQYILAILIVLVVFSKYKSIKSLFNHLLFGRKS